MASPRKKTAKQNDFKTEDSQNKLAPIRQSPRKKTMKNEGLMLLIAAGSVIDQNTENTSYPPQSSQAEPQQQGVDAVEMQPSPSGSSSVEEVARTVQRPQKWTKRNLQTVDAISYEMVVNLPPKTLVDLFAERKEPDNQYGDRMTFRCRFFEDPALCAEEFNGYRNEEQIRRRMEEHMIDHRNFLIKRGKSTAFKTTSVQYRNKMEKQAEIKRKKVSTASSSSKRTSKFTSIKANSTEQEVVQDEDNSEQSDGSTKMSKRKVSKAKKVKRDTPRKQASKQANKENKPTSTASTDTTVANSQQKRPKGKNASVSGASSSDDIAANSTPQDGPDTPKPYPLSDHDYATPAGHERKVFDQSSSDAEALPSDDDESTSSGVSLGSSASQDFSMGIHLYDAGMAGTPMVCKEETFHESLPEKKVFQSSSKATGRGQVYISEEDDGYLDEPIETKVGVKKTRRPALPRTKNDDIPEWEKKLALKYIRELKQRKKDEKIEYICKICREGKRFTAGATLIYHYRSHAGIKPFECADCGQKFTRQHSKNYHMMIHRNESRFVCKDCGKRFRHPSHYNEHKRKHTGETPYECEDCKMKFKTRNTYKRHLKTRHGKLLTARGIKRMSREEFAKVRTKPYKKSNESSPSHEPNAPQNQEPIPGPSGVTPTVELKPRKVRTVTMMTAATTAQSSKIQIAPASVTMVRPASTLQPAAMVQPASTVQPAPMVQTAALVQAASTVQATPMVQAAPIAAGALPPVSTLLPPFTHSQGSATAVRFTPAPTMGTVSYSQPSVGVIPPMGAMRQASPAGMGMLGMTVVGPGIVNSSTSLPTQMTMVHQAVNVGMGQSSITLPNLQGPAYYTITAYTPIAPMETVSTAYAAAPSQPQVDEDDTTHYKPVGYVTHHPQP